MMICDYDSIMLLRLPLKIALWSLAVLFLLNAVTDHRVAYLHCGL
jgi:hypothetical protein